MKIKIICIGKTTDKRVVSFIEEYEKRLKHYAKVEIQYIEMKKKNSDGKMLKVDEGKLILNQLTTSSILILLDELGLSFNSTDFAKFIQKRLVNSQGELVFVIGGAFGFSDELYKRANFKIQLSSMTFTHQMVRIIFIEQLYRAFTILKGEKYHH